jgi:hypothetical protein
MTRDSAQRPKRAALSDLTNTARSDSKPPHALSKIDLEIEKLAQELESAVEQADMQATPTATPTAQLCVEEESAMVEDDEDEDGEFEQGEGSEILYPGHPNYQPFDVTVKNTFIQLDSPCTPEKGTSKEAIAASCPAKYALGEDKRREYEEALEDAEEAAALFAGKDRSDRLELSNFDPSCSVGSLLHKAGLCKPCAWFHHPKGCQRGMGCEFCHCCPPGEIKRRKKEKTLLIRKRRERRDDEHLPMSGQGMPPAYPYQALTPASALSAAIPQHGRQKTLPRGNRQARQYGAEMQYPAYQYPTYGPGYHGEYMQYNAQSDPMMQAQAHYSLSYPHDGVYTDYSAYNCETQWM